tara:strand:+ start:222 stop:830 length:609 start_codon:yes stop_codon:yes gene_type:complete
VNHIPTIGIVGGIGSGKSTVASLFASQGCAVANADENAKKAFEILEVQNQIQDWWGEQIYNSKGDLDTKKIASIVFSDDSERKRLESLIHPIVARFQQEIFDACGDGVIAYVIDAPLLFEAGLELQCDAIVFVEASQETRLRRVLSARGWGENELVTREASQLPLDKKRKKADYVIINEGDLSAVEHRVKEVLEEIRNSDST